MAYLDEKGLTRVFERVKDYVDSRPSSGPSTSYLVKAPVGTIVIWSGASGNIPVGWHLCDGTDGTPNLRDKFVLGAGEIHPVGETGGEETVTLTEAQMPEHKHDIRIYDYTGTNTIRASGGGNLTQNPSDVVANTGAIQVTGGSQPHNNMPPYYALCYIMKMTADETDGGTTFTTDETLTMSPENVLSVSLPTVTLTKDEYNALSTEDKQKDILYVIERSTVTPANDLSIQEYDTSDGWHVRKWTDGYVEMTTRVTNDTAGSTWNQSGGVYYWSGAITAVQYPVTLTKRYSEISQVAPTDEGMLAGWVMPRGIDGQNSLTHSREYTYCRVSAIPTDLTTYVSVEIVVTGRWK